MLSALALVLSEGRGRAQDIKLDPALPYQAKKADPVTYEVDFSAVVTPPYHAKVLKVWLPLPQSNEAQQVTEGELSSFPQKVKPRIGAEKVFGNKFAYFEFDHPEGAQIVRHKFKIKIWELRWDVDPANVRAIKEWPESFAPYLRGEKQAVVVTDDIRKFVRELVPDTKGEGKDLQSVFTWVSDTMKYDHDKASLAASSVNAFTLKAGHCSDYHGLCSALGRALGYPTRMTYGINPFPKNSPSHCKMEAFLPPYGWVSFDVSETQQMIKKINDNKDLAPDLKEKLIAAAKDRLFKGFRDNTWFNQTRGSDYELEPPAAKRAAVVRTIYAEADGVALPEPDPANTSSRAFSWMTVHDYRADRMVTYPFSDWKSLLK
ncbi:MAG: transglutaminase domain-containing protein [Gemmataceae bacterium]